MSENWTKGPWHVGSQIDARYLGGIGDVALIRRNTADDNRYVAMASYDAMGGPDGVVTTTAERNANAYLIAAAPDLYEALTTARSQVVLLGGDAMEDEFGDAIQRAVLDVIDAALLHARGEQP